MRKGCWGEYLDQTKEVTGSRRQQYNAEVHNLYSSTSVIRVTKSKLADEWEM